MLAGDCSVGAVLFLLVGEVFVKASLVALDVQAFADNLYKVGDYHRLGVDIGVETVLQRGVFDDLFFLLLTGVEVAVYILYLIEDVAGLVALDIPVAVVGLEGVGLDYQKSIVVVGGYLRALPCEDVHVYVSVPLRHDRGLVAVYHVQSVENENDGPVGFSAAAADVDDYKVAIFYLFLRVYLGV